MAMNHDCFRGRRSSQGPWIYGGGIVVVKSGVLTISMLAGVREGKFQVRQPCRAQPFWVVQEQWTSLRVQPIAAVVA